MRLTIQLGAILLSFQSTKRGRIIISVQGRSEKSISKLWHKVDLVSASTGSQISNVSPVICKHNVPIGSWLADAVERRLKLLHFLSTQDG